MAIDNCKRDRFAAKKSDNATATNLSFFFVIVVGGFFLFL